MNDSKHVSNSVTNLIGDKIRMEQFLLITSFPMFKGLDLIQSHNNTKRLRIAIPELFLIRIKKRILDISFRKRAVL